jgi:hypothetical protein
MSTLINLTPHDIRVMECRDGENIKIETYKPSGLVARVAVKNKEIGSVNGTPINRPIYGAVENLPDPCDDHLYIVSMIVRDACTGRKDLISPDSGPTAVRNADGQIDYVVGWLSN